MYYMNDSYLLCAPKIWVWQLGSRISVQFHWVELPMTPTVFLESSRHVDSLQGHQKTASGRNSDPWRRLGDPRSSGWGRPRPPRSTAWARRRSRRELHPDSAIHQLGRILQEVLCQVSSASVGPIQLVLSICKIWIERICQKHISVQNTSLYWHKTSVIKSTFNYMVFISLMFTTYCPNNLV